MIPFSPPHIDQKIIDAVTEVLQSGWITTGPRTKQFEKELASYCAAPACLCLNSATAGLETMLRWFGVGPGDEVILPAYTYSATANVVVHCGAKPVLVDVRQSDFNIDVQAITSAITSKTKAIIPVDFGGFPCDYDAIHDLVQEFQSIFSPSNEIQKKLGRILVLSDAAHSLGASYKNRKTGSLSDLSVFSFHAVKNLTTAEGGAIMLRLPPPFDNQEVYSSLCIKTLHGQNKDALAKSSIGNWRYDIIEAGYKCNMTDIAAAMGIIELGRYDSEILPHRKFICESYSNYFSQKEWAEIPVFRTADALSSYHLYPLRIKNITETQRDAIISRIFEKEVSVNVHFIPLPLLSFYRNLSYQISDYPNAYDNFSREISLPVYHALSPEIIPFICQAVTEAVEEIMRPE